MYNDSTPSQPTARRVDIPATRALVVREHRSSYWWILILLVVLVAAGAVGFLIYRNNKASAAAASAAKAAGARPVNVVSEPVARGDMDIYIPGYGTVTPLNVVTVRSRVDGQLQKVLFTEGQIVQKDQLLAVIDTRPFEAQLAQAKGQSAKDQATLKDAQLDLQRYQSLLKQNFSVTQQQVDTQQALVNQLNGSIESDNAQIATANLQITYSNITAPLTGRVGLRMVDPGNMIHATDTSGLLVIAQIQPISVIFTIPEDQIGQVLENGNDGVGLVVDAFDANLKAQTATGTVLALDNQADPTSGTIRIKAEFKNENNALYPNEFVNTKLLVKTLHDAVIVPAEVVQFGPDNNTFAYVVRADNTVELRNIKLGPTEGNHTVILEGLTPGEMVVTEGVDKLQNGSKVTARKQGATTRPAARGRGNRGARGAATRPAGASTRPAGARSRGAVAPATQPVNPANNLPAEMTDSQPHRRPATEPAE